MPNPIPMKQSRRTFLQQTGLLLAGSSFFKNARAAEKDKGIITGIQLYSVRDDMRKDPAGTLKALSEMGFRYVEHANYVNRKFYGYTAPAFRKLLDSLGLKMRSGHTVMGKQHWDEAKKDFTDAWKYTVEDAALAGQVFVISPSLEKEQRDTYDNLLRFMEVFNRCGELCRKSGMQFGYHNHNFEFTEKLNGELLYDLILAHTDPSLVIQQLDMGNLYATGADAYAIIQKHPGRFISLHVKDEIKAGKGEMNDGYESTVLGKGVARTKAITDLGRKIGGTKHFIIEQESYQSLTPLESAKADLAVMHSWGY